MEKITGNLVDVRKKRIFPAEIFIRDGRILDIRPTDDSPKGYILPAFIDSHIHIESSMLTPQHFAEAALRHGTVATVSDPHEIANVLGMEGLRFMIENAAQAPLKFYFGAPSCVPATDFETSGAEIRAGDIEILFNQYDLKFLSEMMNFPGVLNEDPEVMSKIRLAKRFRKRIDGHAPGLRGEMLEKYIDAGIETDHECSDYEEAKEKVMKGMKILIREGSAARNFDALCPLIDEFPDMVMLCSDDLHPDNLIHGHMNLLLKRGVNKGLDLFHLLQAVNANPVNHYGLDVGTLKKEDPADFVMVRDLVSFEITACYIEGKAVYRNGEVKYQAEKQEGPNRFYLNQPSIMDLKISDKSANIRIIEAFDGQLVTRKVVKQMKAVNDEILADPDQDILKILVQNRYAWEKPSVGFIKGFGLKNGAIISSIAHDSHNIVAIGTKDEYMLELITWINKNRGGIAFHDGEIIHGMPLEIAGILSKENAIHTAENYARLDQLVKKGGSTLAAPFMTLSFMALLVIPEIKIGNKGLFDVNKFEFISLYDNE